LIRLDYTGFSAAPQRPRQSSRDRKMPSLRPATALLTATAIVLWWCAAAGPAHAAPQSLRCTNPVSGTTWEVVLDPDRGLVDANAATFTDKWVSWRDPKQGYYDLERATGKLQFRNASSTGGYFLYYTCDKR
jgi:hypothetical protein